MMGKDSISQSIIDLIEPVIHEENLELVEVEYKKSGKNRVLRIYIDKESGVTVDDCQKISRQVEDLIDIDELIRSPYVLEVSSPGLDRPLKKEKDFLRFKDKKVRISTYSPIDNRKNFTGFIRDFRDGTLYLEVEKETVQILFEKIAQARLVIEF